MKHLPPSPSRHRLAALAAGFGLAVLAMSAAHAFTIDNQSNTNSDGSARYSEPEARFSGTGSATTIQQGNTTLRYGGPLGSFDQRYNPNRMFDQNGRPDDNR